MAGTGGDRGGRTQGMSEEMWVVEEAKIEEVWVTFWVSKYLYPHIST